MMLGVPELRRGLELYLREVLKKHRMAGLFENGLEAIYSDLSEFVRRKGKRIRPLLFLLTYRVLNGKGRVSTQDLIQMAAALELFHSFILVHDDVIDRSDQRRGKPTLHRMVEKRMDFMKDGARTGMNLSIVMGDLLFALACETILKTRLPLERKEAALHEFLDCVGETGAGEMYDILHSSREITRVELEDIRRTYFLKTTKYTFECPMVLGGRLAGVSAPCIQQLRAFAYPIGLAFQIQNDLIEFADGAANGKLLISDFMEGKKTLLLRYAYDRVGRVDQLFLQTCFNAKRLTSQVIQRIRQLIIQSSAFSDLQRQVEVLFDDARQTLEASDFTFEQQEGLKELLRYMRQMTLAPAPSAHT